MPRFIRRRHETALRFVAARQSDLSGDDRAASPRWACRWGRPEMVKLLIQRGAPVRERGAEFWATPQAWAQKMGRVQIEAILKGNLEPDSGSI
jgi:hypothetical protein